MDEGESQAKRDKQPALVVSSLPIHLLFTLLLFSSIKNPSVVKRRDTFPDPKHCVTAGLKVDVY